LLARKTRFREFNAVIVAFESRHGAQFKQCQQK
jgi:hypothetical protein